MHMRRAVKTGRNQRSAGFVVFDFQRTAMPETAAVIFTIIGRQSEGP